jgi:hypothetical protein
MFACPDFVADVAKASECLYDKKQKPGMKPGAVESLSRRLGITCHIRSILGYTLTEIRGLRKDTA